MAVEVDRTTTEAGVYPVILLSYLVACQTYETQEDADLVKAFMEYIVPTRARLPPPRTPVRRRWTTRRPPARRTSSPRSPLVEDDGGVSRQT